MTMNKIAMALMMSGAAIAAPVAAQDQPASATATLQDAQGALVGAAIMLEADDQLVLTLTVEGLEAGPRGAHIHMVGQCDAPTFESAGDHWNPADAQHGLDNPQGPHAGDMPNIEIDEEGAGLLEYVLMDVSLEDMLDADGAAMVVHAAKDDQVTDPSGNSGDRIACGAFERDEPFAPPEDVNAD